MGTPTQYKIGGCDVVFPHQAYGVQLSFMNKCVQSLEGSGKTLSLLCSSLAWQQREKKRIEDGLPSAYPPSAAPPPEAPAPGLATEIAQVVAELRRSSYRPRMAILASKKHYCVNKFALSKPSIEEACDELLKEGQCSYFKGTQAVVSSGYSSRMLIIKALQVHDIEELRSFARGQRACPYFLASKWSKVVGLCIEMREADMVFSPYSYLVDPVIRRALDISVEGNMLVFDEAHNMEDVAREAASMHLPAPEVLEIQTSFARAVAMNGKPEVYAPLADALLRLHEWLVAREADVAQGVIRIQKQNRFEKEEVVWQGPQLLAHLKDMALGADAVEALWVAYQAARAEEEAMQQSRGPQGASAPGPAAPGAPPVIAELAVRVGGKALGQTSRLIQILKLLHEVSTDGSRDFRLVFSRTFMGAEGRRGGALRFRRGGDEAGSQWVSAVSLWCLNPEVVFKSLSELAHSTVLTSGTLAPLEGFASELGTPFDVRLEAPHVVDMARQVWAGVIGMAPCRTQLNGVFRNVSTEAYQDGVGASVLALVGIVPDGVLLFFPSYSLLERLTQRWQTTGLWKRLASAKPIVTEPRGGGPEALAEVMKSYYDGVAAGKGGLFMAVSEGLDFADANARAVIIVGLPYPAAYDKQVLEKKAYNDAGRARGLLSGSAWYSQQAFRALNQAIGRCIRHRADWGAIVLLDSRFEAPANQRGLSRWVRGSLTVQPSFDAALGSLRAFFERLASPPPLTLRPKPDPATPGPGAAKQEAGGCAEGGGAQDMGAVLARAPLPRWVSADTASFLAFLEASGCTLAAVGARYASLEAVAQDAVLDCFAAASEWLGDGKTLEQLAAVWKPCLPRGLLAAMGAGDADVAGGQVGSTGWCDAM
ncbi:hypothetical protein APUTEX25_005360 [Auxenochlorella protothecoides]|uniref:Regulator of telomere elongation helicase 1 homolog n=1 Tax=Auxenochlorella protothecoides TaxID=3075 RepID=A0A3M7KWG9_AUXPR|nr:hypothetical protein APUTEX25_005360 [Auxenochlorella protothecoides]|eukprot:RMZ54204.1 hypothetical protein APUTEX25_005360 [Auxenochlorella protothecoides]